MTKPGTYYDTERNYELTVHEDGVHELRVRDVSNAFRGFLAPVRLNPEPIETLAEVPC